ncbi:unnamed protein product [Pocillopora meandrina]|uniref:Protein shisa-5-like n=1 Tax=Pocillopora meandrina TaxID=46732 RepID=A0AAU9XXR6_9CNID|nr:unnamed protein product [Pocillopora meandrina]
MASKKLLCFLFVHIFALGSANYCSDCSLSESCCSDKVCRQRCFHCSYDYQCGTKEQCCDNKCISICSSHCGWSGGAIAGAIIGTIIFFAIIMSIVSYCCCASCPYYRYRTPDNVVVTDQQARQEIVATHTHETALRVDLPPLVYSIQPPPAGYNPPPQGFNQPPPPYSSYPPPPNQYPPPPGQAQAAPIPAAINSGQPNKFYEK